MYTDRQINAVSNILKKNKTNYWTGKEIKKFEREFSLYFGNFPVNLIFPRLNKLIIDLLLQFLHFFIYKGIIILF